MKLRQIFVAIVAAVAIVIITALVINSTSEPKEDITEEVDKNGSIESSVTVEHISDSTDVLITRHKVWTNNNIARNIYYRDTIPSLGKIFTAAENADGDQQSVYINKDYEVYITVK